MRAMSPKCVKRLRPGLHPGPHWGSLQRSPHLYPDLAGNEGKGKEGKGEKNRREGRGGKGVPKECPPIQTPGCATLLWRSVHVILYFLLGSVFEL